MKLNEVTGELIPAGEVPRSVEGEVLGPKTSTAIASLAVDLSSSWIRELQKEWARGVKNDPEYEGKRLGDFMMNELQRLDNKVLSVSDELRRVVRRQAEERASRWSGQRSYD